MERAVKDLLNLFQLLATINRKIWTKLTFRRAPAVATSEKYFEHLMVNKDSLDFHGGLCIGHFKEVNYLMSFSPRDEIETSVYRYGVWEPHLLEKIYSILFGKASGVFVDVGANIGAITVPLAKQFPHIKFFTFEPHPYVFAKLQFNVAVNSLINVKCINKAVCKGSDQNITFYAQKNSATNLGLSGSKRNHDVTEHDVITVNSASLDDELSDTDDAVIAIKIDVQGTELDVLQSAKTIIGKHKPVIFFEYESEYIGDDEGSVQKEYMEFFETLGYDLYHNPSFGSLLPKIELMGYFNGDVIAFPRQQQ